MAQEIIVPANLGALPAIFNQGGAVNEELSGGIVSGFAVLAYRGKVWRVRYRGQEYPLMNADGDPKASADVVVVKSSPYVSKLYYRNGYSEGSNEKPDCWSNNGINPDPLCRTPVASVCATCPNNFFGSRQTEDGRDAKACSDHKRVVVVPLDDMGNEFFGGPMLLRIPAGSLGDLKSYGDTLAQAGYPYFAVGTKIKFDLDPAYPKLLFSAVRVLTAEEGAWVMELRDDPKTIRILNEEPNAGTSGDTPPEEAAAPAPAPASRPTPAAPAPAPRPAPAPAAAAPSTVTQFRAPTQTTPRPAPAPAPRPVTPAGTGAPAPAPRAAPAPATAPAPRAAPAPAPRVAPAPQSNIGAALAAPAPRVAARAPAAAPPPPPPATAPVEEQGNVPEDMEATLAAMLSGQ